MLSSGCTDAELGRCVDDAACHGRVVDGVDVLLLLVEAAVIVIMSREFIISGFRLIASDNGVVIAASMWGKFKTVFQMAMIIALIVIRAFYPAVFWRNFKS